MIISLSIYFSISSTVSYIILYVCVIIHWRRKKIMLILPKTTLEWRLHKQCNTGHSDVCRNTWELLLQFGFNEDKLSRYVCVPNLQPHRRLQIYPSVWGWRELSNRMKQLNFNHIKTNVLDFLNGLFYFDTAAEHL